METDGIELNNSRNEESKATVVNLKAPKKLLYFSDGVMEEYSDSEDECDAPTDNSEDLINVKDLDWAPYMRFQANKMGGKLLSGIDYVGGGLATFFGLTPSEIEIEAAKKRTTFDDTTTDEENSNTWQPAQSKAVVSKELKTYN